MTLNFICSEEVHGLRRRRSQNCIRYSLGLSVCSSRIYYPFAVRTMLNLEANAWKLYGDLFGTDRFPSNIKRRHRKGVLPETTFKTRLVLIGRHLRAHRA